MAVDIAKFRLDFPEFADGNAYTDPQVQFYLDLAQGLSDGSLEGFIGLRWGTKAAYGAELYVAHSLALEKQAQLLAQRGQNPGQILGPVSAGTVDKVSYTRSLVGIVSPKAGHWGLTMYGLRYMQLVRMVGAGPVQVTGCDPGGVFPWPGPQLGPPF